MEIEETVEIPFEQVRLAADVAIPASARGVVVFAHGSGSSRHSPRNRFVAGLLQGAQFGTVLADLLTPEEERLDLQTAEYRFNVALLSARVVALLDWVKEHDVAARLPVVCSAQARARPPPYSPRLPDPAR